VDRVTPPARNGKRLDVQMSRRFRWTMCVIGNK